MRKYLLDTNVVSEVRKQKPHGAVLSWMTNLREEQIYVSAVTLGELQAGVELTRRQDPKKADEIETWIDQLSESLQVLSMDTICFREWARLMNRKPDHLIEDGMIAATARIHRLIVATRNEIDFRNFDVAIVNPFQAGS